MSGMTQDYTNTGTVINANQLYLADELGLSSTAARRLPPKVTLVATMIDRDPQYEPCIDFLQTRLANVACGRPSLIVLHGSDAELHRAFVLRCERLDLRELLGNAEVYIPFGRVKWPQGGSRLESVLRSLNPSFRLPRLAGRAELEAKFRGLAHSVCFSHHVDASGWEPATAELIETWIKYFREDWPDLPPGRLVVAFLCIELPREETDAAKAARAYIEDLRQRFTSDPIVLITKELQPIRKNHVSDWIADFRQYFGDEWDEVTVVDAPMRLFSQGQESRPLGDLFRDLLQLLHEAYRPALGAQPIFLND
jgi:hypothetical protein